MLKTLVAILLLCAGSINAYASDKTIDDILRHSFEELSQIDHGWTASLKLNTIELKQPSAPTIKFYGFIRLDAIYDDSRPNNTQTISFIRSEDPLAPATIATKKNKEDLTIHPRLTRLGFDVDGPTLDELGKAKVTGKVEVDFYNNGLTGQSESRQALRMRHGYIKLGWAESSLLAGQTADLIAPIWPIVNADIVMWGAGNAGDRRPQIRYEYLPKAGEGTIMLQAMMGLSGADDNQDVDSNGFRDGETSGKPTFQFRVGYKFSPWEKQNVEIGIWTHRAWEETDTIFNGEDKFDSAATGLDLSVPYKEFSLKAEYWTGKNVDDIRGGIFQGINTTTGDEIASKGGFIEFGYKATRVYSIHLGYSFDDPDNGDLNSGGRSKNKIYYLANRFNIGPVEIGADYFNWTTEYKGFDEGKDNRYQLYIFYKF